jgi:hypothetical protein
MAYKMAPKGGSNAKTGHGIPMTFRQDGPKQMEFIKSTANKIGSAISGAHEAGVKAYDASKSPDSHWGGSGRKTTYTKNPIEYISGAVKNIMTDEPPKPPKPVSRGPRQEKKKVAPKKEKGFLDTVSEYASSAVDKVKGALSAGDKLVNKAKGSLDDSRRATNNDTMFGVQLSGSNAGSYDATKNPLSSQYKKGPRQVSKGAFKKPTMTTTSSKPKASKPAGPKQMKKKSC